MKLFGNRHGAFRQKPEEELPMPQDLSQAPEDTQDIAEEYIENTEAPESAEAAETTEVHSEEVSEEVPAEPLQEAVEEELTEEAAEPQQEAVEEELAEEAAEPLQDAVVEVLAEDAAEPQQEAVEEASEEPPQEAPEEVPEESAEASEETKEAPEADTTGEEAASGEDGAKSGEETEEADDGKPPMAFWKKMLISCGVTVVVLGVAVALTVNYFLGLLNYQAANSDYFKTVSAASELEEEAYEDSYLQALDEADAADDLEATEEELLRWNNHIDDIISDDSTYQIPISEDVYNILLIGTDNRQKDGVGRSDVMMLVSINHKTETIHLTSFLRDCYVAIPGYGKTRLNHAFAYGGPDKLMETLEQNFKVHVDRYVAVDFYSFMDVVDTLGGVWVYMTEEEIKVANKYIWSMNTQQLDLEWSDGYIWGDEGWRKLTGKQALGHARNRFTGSDYERTARQRNIINMILYGCMYAQPSTLVDLAQVILPQITTDMTKSEILNYAANIGAYVNYDIQQHQIPAEGTYSGATISGMSVISLDLDDNIEYLQGTIYAGTEALEETAEPEE